MIGTRGFQMVEPPRASSGSARIQRSFAAENRTALAIDKAENRAALTIENAENRAALAIEDMEPRRIATPQRSRSPPWPPDAERGYRTQIRRWASGGHRQPRQTNLHPNRLRNGVSYDFSPYLGSRSMQEPCQPS